MFFLSQKAPPQYKGVFFIDKNSFKNLKKQIFVSKKQDFGRFYWMSNIN